MAWHGVPPSLQAPSQLQQWKKTFAVIQQHMGAFLSKFPPYLWLTVLSQLTSRVCHANNDVATVNNKILLKAALAYPQQASKQRRQLRHQLCMASHCRRELLVASASFCILLDLLCTF